MLRFGWNTNTRSAGILSRANEIERLQAQQKEAAAALDKLRGEQKEAQRLLEQANYDLTNAETDLRTAEDAALRLQGFSLYIRRLKVRSVS